MNSPSSKRQYVRKEVLDKWVAPLWEQSTQFFGVNASYTWKKGTTARARFSNLNSIRLPRKSFRRYYLYCRDGGLNPETVELRAQCTIVHELLHAVCGLKHMKRFKYQSRRDYVSRMIVRYIRGGELEPTAEKLLVYLRRKGFDLFR